METLSELKRAALLTATRTRNLKMESTSKPPTLIKGVVGSYSSKDKWLSVFNGAKLEEKYELGL